MSMCLIRSWVARTAVVAVAAACVSCGSAAPDQVAGATATPADAATATPAQSPTVAGAPAAPVTVLPTEILVPSPTANTRATSNAVFAAFTALAASPTYPPTSTPRPYRTPISAGPQADEIPPTALFSSGGIGVLTISAQVMRGGVAALTIMAIPAAVCLLKNDRSTANAARFEPIPGAATRVTGRDGVAAWIWNIDANEPAGMMPLVVDCGSAGTAQLQLKVVE